MDIPLIELGIQAFIRMAEFCATGVVYSID
jgi:hypothetical protein